VIGDNDRPPTADELKTMTLLGGGCDGRMAQWALSTSLIYAPAFYAKTDELIAMAKVAAEKAVFYAQHIRNEGDKRDCRFG